MIKKGFKIKEFCMIVFLTCIIPYFLGLLILYIHYLFFNYFIQLHDYYYCSFIYGSYCGFFDFDRIIFGAIFFLIGYTILIIYKCFNLSNILLIIYPFSVILFHVYFPLLTLKTIGIYLFPVYHSLLTISFLVYFFIPISVEITCILIINISDKHVMGNSVRIVKNYEIIEYLFFQVMIYLFFYFWLALMCNLFYNLYLFFSCIFIFFLLLILKKKESWSIFFSKKCFFLFNKNDQNIFNLKSVDFYFTHFSQFQFSE